MVPFWIVLSVSLLTTGMFLFFASTWVGRGGGSSERSAAYRLSARQHTALDDLPRPSRGPVNHGEAAVGSVGAGAVIGALPGDFGSLSPLDLLLALATGKILPPQRPTDIQFPEAELSDFASGKMTYGIPERMPVQKVQIVEVRIGSKDTPRLEQGFVSAVPPKSYALRTVDHMSVTLRGDPGCFSIKALSPQVQDVSSLADAQGEFELFGRWVFEVRPIKTGRRNLFVIVGGEIAKGSSRAAKLLPEREFPVLVHVGWGQIAGWVMRATAGVAALLATTVVGLAVQDYWWPPVRALISGLLP
jgi:hypothetical protein